ncbi:MAG: hypothetical protein V3V13_09245 [Paracoccaceae bacterium]
MAIRISWWLGAAILIAVILMVFLIENNMYPVFVMLAIVLAPFFIWSISLIAVVWHRYILLVEIPRGIIPYRKGLSVWMYFWYGVGIGLLLMLTFMVFGFILALIIPFIIDIIPISPVLLPIIILIISTILFYRMALILPSVAIDDTLSLADAFRESRGFTWDIIVMAVLLALANIAINLVIAVIFGLPIGTDMSSFDPNATAALTGVNSILHMVISIAFAWFTFILNISILTTLYGHIVERRQIG